MIKTTKDLEPLRRELMLREIDKQLFGDNPPKLSDWQAVIPIPLVWVSCLNPQCFTQGAVSRQVIAEGMSCVSCGCESLQVVRPVAKDVYEIVRT